MNNDIGENVEIHKIKVPHAKIEENHLYIQYKRPKAVYIKRIRKLILKGFTDIIIFCMGASIRKGLYIVDDIKKMYPLIKIEITPEEKIARKIIESTIDGSLIKEEENKIPSLKIQLTNI